MMRRTHAECRTAVAAAAMIAVAVATAGTAAAHQSAVKYLDLDVRGAVVAIELRLVPSDLTRPLGLADDATATVDQAMVGATQAAPFVAAWLTIRADTAVCPASPPTLTRVAADPRFLAVSWTATCMAPIERLSLDLAGFFAIDRAHGLLLHLTAPDADPYDATIGIADAPVALVLGDAGPSGALGWIAAGVTGVVGHRDRLTFLLALVVVVSIVRRPDGGWTRRPAIAAVRAAAMVVGAFAISHAAAVIAVAQGWVAPPPRFVAAMIAVSVGFVAIENAVAPDGRRRELLALGFGLVHGLGFATAPPPLVDPIVALAPFTLGVGLAQAAVAACALAVCGGIARVTGPGPYRIKVIPVVSAMIAITAAVNLIGL
jgi:hypothetical protein